MHADCRSHINPTRNRQIKRWRKSGRRVAPGVLKPLTILVDLLDPPLRFSYSSYQDADMERGLCHGRGLWETVRSR